MHSCAGVSKHVFCALRLPARKSASRGARALIRLSCASTLNHPPACLPPCLRQAITIKERRSGWFRLSSYYVARCIADLPLDVIVPIFFVLILYFMAALRAAAFIPHLLAVLLAVLVATSVGLLLSAVVMELKQAQSLASVLTLTIMLCGGFYIQK
jgi:hypothetical protein